MEKFRVRKLPLETLIQLFIDLYENGYDYVDLEADDSDPVQDKLITFTLPGYKSPDFEEDRASKFDYEDDDNDSSSNSSNSSIEVRKLTDDDINNLM